MSQSKKRKEIKLIKTNITSEFQSWMAIKQILSAEQDSTANILSSVPSLK